MTYMNRSGQSVVPFSKFYQIAPEAILIAHDELDMNPGVIRLKTGGGHGGHNGLRDIVPHITKFSSFTYWYWTSWFKRKSFWTCARESTK